MKPSSIKKILMLLAVTAIAVQAGVNRVRHSNSDRPHFVHSTVSVTSADGTKNSFEVEVANTVQEQAYGLMFLTTLDADKGMIFPDRVPHEVAFWMKNTLIPLDMLFVRPDGRIGRIVAQARPQDLTPIPSQEPVIAVIEIKGGEAERRHITSGDKVSSPALALNAQ